MDKIGILSILEGQPHGHVKRLWELFEKKYNSTGVQTFPHPNITFGGGEIEHIKEFSEDLKSKTLKLKPFEIEVCGIGHFDNRVIFIKVKKSQELTDLHRSINQVLKMHSHKIFEYYTPENWVPHITLAMDDLTIDNFSKSWSELDRNIRFKQVLHNICIVKFLPSGKINTYKKYKLF